ncbi:MAG TPA: hypothetical protein V6D47_03905 [Oscillatoriaceae cyanobacterium]
MTLEALRPPLSPTTPEIARERTTTIRIEVVNALNMQEATLRRVITPMVEIDQESRVVRVTSQGLGLTEERRVEGERATLLEVAARYRRGTGGIKQSYRYLIFLNAEERGGKGTVYAVRLPMGTWTPDEPDTCLDWLGRGGFQQGDFVLLPRKRLPVDAEEIPRPQARSFWQSAAESMRRLMQETLGEAPTMDEWTRLIGRHDPKDTLLYRKDGRLFLHAPADTEVLHPEHATLALPAGIYEVVEDRATSYWRKAID